MEQNPKGEIKSFDLGKQKMEEHWAFRLLIPLYNLLARSKYETENDKIFTQAELIKQELEKDHAILDKISNFLSIQDLSPWSVKSFVTKLETENPDIYELFGISSREELVSMNPGDHYPNRHNELVELISKQNLDFLNENLEIYDNLVTLYKLKWFYTQYFDKNLKKIEELANSIDTSRYSINEFTDLDIVTQKSHSLEKRVELKNMIKDFITPNLGFGHQDRLWSLSINEAKIIINTCYFFDPQNQKDSYYKISNKDSAFHPKAYLEAITEVRNKLSNQDNDYNRYQLAYIENTLSGLLSQNNFSDNNILTLRKIFRIDNNENLSLDRTKTLIALTLVTQIKKSNSSKENFTIDTDDYKSPFYQNEWLFRDYLNIRRVIDLILVDNFFYNEVVENLVFLSGSKEFLSSIENFTPLEKNNLKQIFQSPDIFFALIEQKSIETSIPLIQEILDSEFLIKFKEKIFESLNSVVEHDINKFTRLLEILNNKSPGFKENYITEKSQKLQDVIIEYYKNKENQKAETISNLLNSYNIKPSQELKFIQTLHERYSGIGNSLMAGYFLCKDEGVFKNSDLSIVLEFTDQFKVISPNIMKVFLEAKRNKISEIFVQKIKDIAGKIITSKMSQEEKNLPYYNELLIHIYPNNAERYGSHESNLSCQDRSGDIEKFSFKEEYKLDLLGESKISLKKKEVLNPKSLDKLQEPILNLRNIGEDKTEVVEKKVEKLITKLAQSTLFEEINLQEIGDLKQKMFLILISGVFEDIFTNAEIKESLTNFWFLNTDLLEYINGTTDRVNQSSNKDYSLLCELSEFYNDNIKEINRELITSSVENPVVKKVLKKAFENYQAKKAKALNAEEINKLQLDKLGLNEGFINQIRKTLIDRKLPKGSTKEDRQRLETIYTPERIKSIISRYESITKGLGNKKSSSDKKLTQAFYGKLQGQRDKTFSAARILGASEMDLLNTPLSEINLASYLELQKDLETGKYDESEFVSFVSQKMGDIFIEEKTLLETEINKFVSEKGTTSKSVKAYFSKTAESSNARMVGGVCVSMDNPDKYPDQNIWDMENYFQLVMYDPNQLKCLGLVLLHHFEDERNQKILTASFNPSSTFLYSTDQEMVFSTLYNSLVEFAKTNSFNKICISQNTGIRTNRTGGIFEKTMNQKVAEYKSTLQENSTYSFKNPVVFSHHPQYQMSDMDIIWQKQ